MILRILAVTVLLSLSACMTEHKTLSDVDPLTAASAVVKEMKLGGNLEQLVSAAVLRTTTYRIMVSQVGAAKANELIQKETQSALAKYQDQWDTNLAKSYLEYFSVEELQSLSKDRQSSPYAAKFSEKQRDVGLSMQAKSTDLLEAVVFQVVSNAYKQTSASK